jgi:S-DNA-T family DNA segregation ATPase FtsK/SpoIIIE
MPRKSAQTLEREKQHIEEIYGIALIALSALIGAFLFTSATGIIGSGTALFLKWTVGVGRFLIPVFLFFGGVMNLVHRTEIDLKWVGIGLAACFISVVSIIHLNTPETKEFERELIFAYGGVLGASFVYVFRTLLGTIGSYILFITALLIGLVCSTGISVSNLIFRVRDKALDVWQKKQTQPLQIELNRGIEYNQAPKTIEHAVELIEESPPELEEMSIDESEAGKAKTQQLQMLDEDFAASSAYSLPPLDLLKRTSRRDPHSRKNIKENIRILERTLHNFDVEATIGKVVQGPQVTRYEIQLATGVKVGRILGLADDIALALASADVRILAPIPGKSAIGIEVPNKYRELVTLGDILASPEAKRKKSKLIAGLGKDINGQPVFADLGEMPHLLIAGATGSGKSVCINSILVSILARLRPDEVKMILIDPKRVELSAFNDMPHLITPVVTNPKRASTALGWAVSEMEDRFMVLAEAGARNIGSYNANRDAGVPAMHYIVIIIDELADLMMAAPNEVEDAICRLAQMARAVGIHLVVATQRPSVDIITGLIKANITSRIAFAVSSQMDSRVILDTPGAEKLVGKGDMLFVEAGSKPMRIQSAFVTEQEVELVTSFIRRQAKPDYKKEILKDKKRAIGPGDFEDELLDIAMDVVVNSGQASISMLQRRLRVGYARAARLIDMLEEKGVVGGYEGSKPRAVLITSEELAAIKEAKNSAEEKVNYQ